jgi:hypothetical protein
MAFITYYVNFENIFESKGGETTNLALNELRNSCF